MNETPRIIVEGRHDEKVVGGFLRRLQPDKNFEIIVAGKALHPKSITLYDLFGLELPLHKNTLIVFDQEFGSIADEVNLEDDQSRGYPIHHIRWCPAIPQIEAWLFADEAALAYVAPESTKSTISRLPSPESIPFPKMLKHYLLRDNLKLSHLFDRIDLDHAAARCPSLANFLNNVQDASGLEQTFDIVQAGSRQIDRDIIRSIISEVFPSNKSIFLTASGRTITAAEMMEEISSGTMIGQEYATSMLRVARDLLAIQAQRSTKKPQE